MSADKSEPGARFAHVNLVAADWRRLADFYQDVFGCVPIPPERDLQGEWLDRSTGLRDAHIRGTHLRLPGHGDDGPTLEIFEYAERSNRPPKALNVLGLAHLAFAVEDVEETAGRILNAGGSAVGDLTRQEIPGAGTITFRYMADPEGNVIEIQRWITTK